MKKTTIKTETATNFKNEVSRILKNETGRPLHDYHFSNMVDVPGYSPNEYLVSNREFEFVFVWEKNN